MFILIYRCGPRHAKAMKGISVGGKKQSLSDTLPEYGQACPGSYEKVEWAST